MDETHLPGNGMDAAERLESLRDSYELGALSEDELAPTWLEQFERWLGSALGAGMPEPHAMVLATAAPDGAPGARTVLLRGVDARGFRFNTNYRSRKGRELEQNPRATLVFPWYQQQRQVIVDGEVTRLDLGESDDYFAKRPRASRIAAAASPQSEVIESREQLERRFAELEAELEGIADPPRPSHWGGYLVAPHSVEFWQGRRNRLHDRLRFRRSGAGAWVVERLAP
ncbi:MAG TPA: pyridoxamine 5'-phosphate oxidase [Thermoleophilaceae bacterium]|nr:pyridoxamine 5'-phosphate oxidase [Thermoleophilaceae bacterium]